jgi:hypothetical protein
MNERFMPLRLNTPSLAMGMKGGGTPTVAPKERRGVCFGGMKPLEGGFILTLV